MLRILLHRKPVLKDSHDVGFLRCRRSVVGVVDTEEVEHARNTVQRTRSGIQVGSPRTNRCIGHAVDRIRLAPRLQQFRLGSPDGPASKRNPHVLTGAERGRCIAVVGFEFRPGPFQQRLLTELDGHDAVASEHLMLLIGHLAKQQMRELFDVVAVGQVVVAQHNAELP